MSIISSPFGPTILTGADAEAFERQMEEGGSPLSDDRRKRIRKMAAEWLKNGRVRLSIRRNHAALMAQRDAEMGEER